LPLPLRLGLRLGAFASELSSSDEDESFGDLACRRERGVVLASEVGLNGSDSLDDTSGAGSDARSVGSCAIGGGSAAIAGGSAPTGGGRAVFAGGNAAIGGGRLTGGGGKTKADAEPLDLRERGSLISARYDDDDDPGAAAGECELYLPTTREAQTTRVVTRVLSTSGLEDSRDGRVEIYPRSERGTDGWQAGGEGNKRLDAARPEAPTPIATRQASQRHRTRLDTSRVPRDKNSIDARLRSRAASGHGVAFQRVCLYVSSLAPQRRRCFSLAACAERTARCRNFAASTTAPALGPMARHLSVWPSDWRSVGYPQNSYVVIQLLRARAPKSPAAPRLGRLGGSSRRYLGLISGRVSALAGMHPSYWALVMPTA